MSSRYKNKYRTESSRLQNWDYSWNSAYYVTICTKNRERCFGEIVKGQMNLSEIGTLANTFWTEIHDHFQYVFVDEFIVMPNHVHGILIIDKPENERHNVTSGVSPNGRDKAMPCLSRTDNPIKYELQPGQKRFQNQGRNTLSSIVGSYKSILTRYARKINEDFAWQPGFYDHLIRDDESMAKIRYYIRDNPEKWAEDQLNPGNIINGITKSQR